MFFLLQMSPFLSAISSVSFRLQTAYVAMSSNLPPERRFSLFDEGNIVYAYRIDSRGKIGRILAIYDCAFYPCRTFRHVPRWSTVSFVRFRGHNRRRLPLKSIVLLLLLSFVSIALLILDIRYRYRYILLWHHRDMLWHWCDNVTFWCDNVTHQLGW